MQQIEYKSLCNHKGVTKVGVAGKAEIYAGSMYEIRPFLYSFEGKAIFVSCGGTTTSEYAEEPIVDFRGNSSKTLKRAFDRTPFPDPYESVVIGWDDAWSPPVSITWWKAFFNDISEFDGKVIFYCQGGHGRTGTALAIIAGLAGWAVDAGVDVVAWVRSKYCADSVETKNQIEWLTKHVDKTIKSIPAHDLRVTANKTTDDKTGSSRVLSKGLTCDVCEKKTACRIDADGFALCEECSNGDFDVGDDVLDITNGCDICHDDVGPVEFLRDMDSYACQDCIKSFGIVTDSVRKMMDDDGGKTDD